MNSMKSGIFVLALLILALVALPLAPSGASSPAVAQSGDAGDATVTLGYGRCTGASMSDARNGMMRGAGSPMPSPRGGRHGHERPAETRVQQELRRDPFDWNVPVRTIRFCGYRRLSGKNILEHEKRQLIYTTILLNPGIEIPALVTLTGINLHTLRYHLGQLMQMKKIACIEQGSGYHFFENHGRYDPADQQRILYRRYPTTNQILTVIGAHPGITRGGIAVELGIAGPSVTRWTQRLIAEGAVTEVRNGRRVHYYSAQDSGSMCANT